MEAETASASSGCGDDDGQQENQVMLNVYDLTPFNSYTYWFGVGIFHSGIEVHGMEFGYGAHDFPASGVFEVEPRSCPGFVYRCSLPLGHIKMPPQVFRKFIGDLAAEYHGDTYNLISKNCNHFTDDVAQRLTGNNIPAWVNRLAWLASGSACDCLLPENLQATTVKQLPKYNGCSVHLEEGSQSFSFPPCEGTENNTEADQVKHRLLSSAGNGDVAFVKEVHTRNEAALLKLQL